MRAQLASPGSAYGFISTCTISETFRVAESTQLAESLEGQLNASNLTVAGTLHHLYFLFLFVGFYKCILGAGFIVKNVEIFKNHGCNDILESFHPVNIARCPIPP